MVNFMGIRALVVDTAGTTTDLDFIQNVLFSYSSQVLAQFLEQNQHQVLVESCLQDVREIALEPNADLARITEILQQWIAEDRKATPLKTLQGLIWKNGYHSGQFTGHVYQDFIENISRLKQMGTRLYSFSSGSVASQAMLFAHSDGGDLTHYFNGHFDTRTGNKLDRQAYLNILNTISLAPKQVLFISDVVAELEAASLAGMQVALMKRQGTQGQGMQDSRFRGLASFAELVLN